jgi:hypothetical protein
MPVVKLLRAATTVASVVWLLLAVAACGGAGGSKAAPDTCGEGASRACVCRNGAAGSQLCSSGAFAGCSCTAPDAGSTDASSTDAGSTDAGEPDTDAGSEVDAGSDLDTGPEVDAGGAEPVCDNLPEMCDGVDNDCDGQTDEVSCDDGQACTKDLCAGKNGCQNMPLNNEPCDADGSLCTTDDKCQGGVCTAGAKFDCNDGNACTDDACTSVSGCVHLANAVTCNDGDGCTTADQCSSTVCLAGGPKSCDDGNPCTADSCVSTSGSCVHKGDFGTGQACDADGSVCTSGDACASGKCVPGKTLTCDDQNPCTVDSCNPVKGCVAKPVADKTDCASDGQSWCMLGTCVAQSACGPGFEPLPIDVDGVHKTTCMALGPVWGQRPVKPVGVYTVKTLAGANVVEDSQTQLMWQQGQAPGVMPWAEAAAYCDKLDYAGFKDWRLPASHELATLIDYTIAPPGPTLDLAAFPQAKAGFFWSGTKKIAAPEYVWRANFYKGRVNVAGISSFNDTRCVRGTAPEVGPVRFQYSAAGGVVIDSWTQLHWQRAVEAGLLNWQAAKTYCKSLSLEGGGWRLPTVRELHGIADPQQANPSIHPVAFPNSPVDWFWSITPLAGSATDAWYGNFNNGAIGNYGFDDPYEVRCVRSP